MIIKLIGMIYGRHSKLYRQMIDSKKRKKIQDDNKTTNCINNINYRHDFES